MSVELRKCEMCSVEFKSSYGPKSDHALLCRSCRLSGRDRICSACGKAFFGHGPRLRCKACYRQNNGTTGRTIAKKTKPRKAPSYPPHSCPKCGVEVFDSQVTVWCLSCQKVRTCVDCLESFDSSSVKRSRCATCHATYTSYGHAARQYGLSAERYEELRKAQSGLCAICSRPERTLSKTGNLFQLAVDHDHACCEGPRSCGKCVRGLVCRGCNIMLGQINDDPAILLAAVSYLTTDTKL